MAKFFTIAAIMLLLQSYTTHSQTKILFDASKAEMAGNADWIIDADQTNIDFSGSTGHAYITSSSGNQSNPSQIPTPPQSGITASTSEMYWNGAISAWAVDCVKRGYTVETLPWNGSITYGDAGNPQDLSNYKVFIVDEPNIAFSATEKTALMQFVQAGGGLFMISDHNISDRNGDGWDSPHIWDDFLSNNSVQPYPFGIYFDTANFSQTSSNISATATDSIIHGPMGNVSKVQWAGGTTMTLDPIQNASVKGVIFKNGTTPGNTNAMVAYARYGQGNVAALGDSSPADDGTGNPNCSLYPGYFGDAAGNHQLLLMNMTIWLAGNVTTAVGNATFQHSAIRIYPNPAINSIRISTDKPLYAVHIVVYNSVGQVIADNSLPVLNDGDLLAHNLCSGFYMIKITSDSVTETVPFTVR